MNQNIKPKSKCRFLPYSILFFNIALTAVIGFLIKQNDEERLLSKNVDKDLELKPVDEDVLDAQSRISSDRENRLRDLNTSPKEIKRVDTTTTTTTTTVTEEKKADSKTKSS